MKLTERSRAVMLLRKKLRTDQIAYSDNRKAIWESDPFSWPISWKIFVLSSTKSRRNRRKQRWTNCFCCTIEKEPSRNLKLSNLEEEEESSTAHLYAEEKSSLHTLQPIHLVSKRVEPGTTTKRLKVAILMPSGVLSRNFSIRVSEDGCALELSVTCPKPLFNLKMLHRKWLLSKKTDRIERYHLKLIGFEHHLKTHRLCSSDKVESMARINLPLQVQIHISEKFNLTRADSSARVVYVELRGQEDLYVVSNDNEPFEIC